MTKVELLKTGKDGKIAVTGTVVFDGNKVRYSDDTSKAMIHSWNTVGILGAKGKRYTPKDGEEFVRNLPWQYHNEPYMWAEVVPEENKGVRSEKSLDW
jgi:hypothetical protein